MDRYPTWPNLPSMVFATAAARTGRPALWAKRGKDWHATNWEELARAAAALARSLRARGVGQGDRVLLVAENRPEWIIADTAIMAVGAVSVGAYTTNTPADHAHVLRDCGARVAIVSTRALAQRLLAGAREAAGLDLLIAIEPPDAGAEGAAAILPWAEAVGGDAPPDDIVASAAAIPADALACLIYTSGTGGAPKGVMLSHRAILANCAGAFELLRPLDLFEETHLSFLPLSHAFEHTCGLFLLSLGSQTYFVESADKVAPAIAEVRPTVMVTVPRLLEVIQERIRHQLARAGGLKAWLFEKAVAIGLRNSGPEDRRNLVERLVDPLLDRLVRAKVRARFGGRLKGIMSGGAPLSPEVGGFFLALGLRVMQGYGQTEAAPVISANPPGRIRIETVGPPFFNVELRIAEDGEILVRGPLVMEGYWNNQAATDAVIRDGWLHTGDVGVIDADGYLRITDRKKDIIVLSGGDNVSPARIEGMLVAEPEIAQAMVVGDKRPYLTALIVPAEATVHAAAKEAGRAPELAALAEEEGLRKRVAAALDRVNSRLPVTEKVRRFAIAGEAFTIENGLMTPTLKVRRHLVRGRFGAAMDALYG
ncbi:MAG: long-chain fatty acid--CoA ligase [Alphaproteobacteria bacterium]|nr:long-chain fatty acid--CoA ligase [Alphaproteobacteria bacterium]